jgi:hypothetical protein
VPDTNYLKAMEALAEDEVDRASVYAMLYLGEQVEVATGVLQETAPNFDPRLREDTPSPRRKR